MNQKRMTSTWLLGNYQMMTSSDTAVAITNEKEKEYESTVLLPLGGSPIVKHHLYEAMVVHLSE